MSVTDGRPSRTRRVISWSIGGVVAAGFLVAAMGTRLTFFGEQPSPYDDYLALLYVNGAIGSIAAAGLIVAWIRRSRPMGWAMVATPAFAVVLAGIAVVEQRGRDRLVGELHDVARGAADDFDPPTDLAARERTEFVASWDRNRDFGNVRIILRPASIAPDPSAIVDDLTTSFCESNARAESTPVPTRSRSPTWSRPS